MDFFKNREQITAVYALVVATLFMLLAFYNTDAEVYLFPRIIAVALAIFSVILFISNARNDRALSNDDTTDHYLRYIWPGLLVGIPYLILMETLGFYFSSLLAFLAIVLIYGKRRLSDLKALTLKLSISICFMLILYLLFWQGLHVRTPTGFIF